MYLNNFIGRLRNRGYDKKFLTTLFRKIEFGSRNKLLAISEDNIDYLEIDSHRSDTVLINDAERMFQDIFSEVTLPREKLFLSSLLIFQKKKKHLEKQKLYVFLVFLSNFSDRRVLLNN